MSLFGEEEVSVPSVEFDAFLWRNELVDQDNALQTTQRILHAHRFPHCSLIVGPQGSAPLVLALSIAQDLFCLNGSPACGTCTACYKTGMLIHPDLHFSFPLFGAGEVSIDHYENFRKAVQANPWLSVQNWLAQSDKENKQANITAREARSIIDRMYLKPYESDRNVLILWMAEYLGKESNILLKLLEEPPGHAYIILVTEDGSSLLPTVKSRTQQFYLRPISDTALAAALARRTGIHSQDALGIALSTEGNLALALDLSSGGKLDQLQWIQQMLQAAYRRELTEIWAWIDVITNLNRDQQRSFLQFFTRLLSLSLRIQSGSYSSETKHPVIDYAAKLSQQLNVNKVHKINDLVDLLSYHLSRNANVRILLHDYLNQLSELIRNKE